MTRKENLKAGASIALLGALCVFGFTAVAQDDSNLEITGEVTAVVGVVDGDMEADSDARLRVKSSTILESGLEVGGVLEARVDGQTGRQYWAGGRYSSVLSGGPRGVVPLNGGDAYLQGAYAYARGGFGEISVGRDNGIASQLAVTSPTVFNAIGVNDWKSDLTGLNDVQTVNDFSGYSTKLTYMPPANFLGGALGGLQVGVSYSPELEDCKDDLCAPTNGYDPSALVGGVPLTGSSSWKDVFETAVYYEKVLRGAENDIRVGVGASYVSAAEDVETTAATGAEGFDDYEAFALGLNVAINGLTFGGSVRNTNAGLDLQNDDGYLAFDAGITYETGQWGFMVGYGASDAERDAAAPFDPSFFRETQMAQAGVSYVFDQGVTLGAAAQFVDSEKSVSIGGDEDKAAVVFESSIKF